jgi:hypothetical protein
MIRYPTRDGALTWTGRANCRVHAVLDGSRVHAVDLRRRGTALTRGVRPGTDDRNPRSMQARGGRRAGRLELVPSDRERSAGEDARISGKAGAIAVVGHAFELTTRRRGMLRAVALPPREERAVSRRCAPSASPPSERPGARHSSIPCPGRPASHPSTASGPGRGRCHGLDPCIVLMCR